MQQQKNFHTRNLHNSAYDFKALIKSHKPLQRFVKPNKYGNLSIDFSNDEAVIALNKALLIHFYNLQFWEIPKGYLCPPIPGRVDYIHYLTDLLNATSSKTCIKNKKIRGLDIGVGANGIYTLLANKVYDYEMVGSDIDKKSLQNMQNIIKQNDLKTVSLRHQHNAKDIFNHIIYEDDRFDFTLCNPPFHKSKKEAQSGSQRKVQNLSKQKSKEVKLNFGGQSNELWCQGGEVAFIKNMIHQSKQYEKNVLWFTSLVSKKENLKLIQKFIKKVEPKRVEVITMQQGQKITRFLAWSFYDQKEQELWSKKYWV